MIAQAVILLEIGIFAVSFGVVMARRGYIEAHKKPYRSRNSLLPMGVALIVVGLTCIIAGIVLILAAALATLYRQVVCERWPPTSLS